MLPNMAGCMAAPEERIADAFNRYFANFNIRVEAGEVRVGSRRDIRTRGWRITFRVMPDDAGSPSLEFYATHRMTNDRHVRIWADGHVEELDAILAGLGSRRGPVNDRATTGNDPIARERKRPARQSGDGITADQRAGPSYLAKVRSRVRVPSSALKKLQVRAGASRALSHAQGDPAPKGSRMGSSLVRGFVTGMGEENEGRAAQC